MAGVLELFKNVKHNIVVSSKISRNRKRIKKLQKKQKEIEGLKEHNFKFNQRRFDKATFPEGKPTRKK